MKRQRIIGVFDSGVGGLTVSQQILAKMPEVRIVYLGDTARVPYGHRSTDELIRFGEEIITFLIGQGAEAVVAACNTSSATALPVLRERFEIPLVGMIDAGARLAVQKTFQGRIGLLATETTVRSRAYTAAVSRTLSKGVLPEDRLLREAWQRGEQPVALLKAQACSLFVPLVEAGLANSAEARGIARVYIGPLMSAGVDTVILGCTHYPFLAPVVREIMGEDVTIVDPATAVVEDLQKILAGLEEGEPAGEAKVEEVRPEDVRAEEVRAEAVGAKEVGAEENRKKEVRTEEAGAGDEKWRIRYYVSGDPGLFRQVGGNLLGQTLEEVRQVVWPE